MLSDARTDPLLRKEILPEAVPETVGLNVTVKGTLCPAAMVRGNVTPLSVKAELLDVAEEIAALPPLALMLPFWLWLFPMVIDPKLIDAGEIPIVEVEVVAVPVSVTATEGSDALELIMRVAVSVPATVGANFTDRVALAPAASAYGKVSPLTLKPVPLTLSEEIVRLEPPVLETVSPWLSLVPVEIVPRFMLDGALK
jgi:hypothetical protein